MSHLYLAYGTTDGHTAKVVDALRQAIEAAGHRVTVDNLMLGANGIPDYATGVILAASLHAGQLQAEVKQFITAQHERLTALPGAMITVCLAVTDGESGRQRALGATKRELQPLDWQPDVVELVAGARCYTKYGFFKRLLIRWKSKQAGCKDLDISRDYDYTDYEALGRFGVDFAERVAATEAQRTVTAVPTP
jgi:menaquinone-dependent protoporphyrinogen oxidase